MEIVARPTETHRLSAPVQLDVFTPKSRDRYTRDALIRIARELAQRAGREGCTVADLRVFAASRGLIEDAPRDRRLSWLGSVMKQAGLVATNEFRRSHLPNAHGNLGRVWVSREWAR